MTTALAPKTEFRFSFHAAFGQIDAEKGTLRDVSLMTEGEALGHGVWCDQKTLQSVFALAQKSPVKAYLTHGDFFQPDRLGDEVGLFSGLYIEGNQLKAKQFTFFKSFITSEKKKYEALMELAQADASLFGVSISFSGKLAWVMPDGSEVPAEDDEMPEGALNSMPSVRVTRIYSADFVSDPAANPNGLFDARLQAAAKLLGIPLPSLSSPSPLKEKGAETPAKVIDGVPNNETKTTFTMIKDIRAKFDKDPVKFARACELFAENEKITLSEIESKIAGEAEASRVKAIETELANLKSQLAAKDEEIKKLSEEKAAAAKGADPLKLGNEGAKTDTAAVFEAWTKLSGKEATIYWEANKPALLAYKMAQK